MTAQNAPPNGGEVFAAIQELIEDVAEDWDVGEITVDSRLVELGMESISLVYLVAELQQQFDLGDKLFSKMRSEGTLLKDMTVGDIVVSIESLR